MSVPLSSADLSQSDAGDALGDWERSTTSPVPRTHSPESTTAEAAASESPPPVEPLSDAELLAAFVQRKDADAFTEIVQRYRLLVYRVALRAVDDRHLADDVFQATFLVLAQSAHKIKSGDVLAAWLRGTARNIARRALGNQYAEQKQLKDWAKQTLAQKGEEMATSTEPDPFEELARRHEQQLLDEELQQLPEASRAPLVLFYLEKKTQAEIAQIMGLSVEAVEGRLKRAKQELRTRLIRRGVLLSTVVAAATVLTPSITFAAPAASLVSATVTTALGTAALGSTALGATAVTGAATSSQLAAGSASASTLAAQEIALMSVTSKATAMLITTAASTTLISGLVLGAMVGTFTTENDTTFPPAGSTFEEQADTLEIVSDEHALYSLSLEDDEPVLLALVDEPPTSPQSQVTDTSNLSVSDIRKYDVSNLDAKMRRLFVIYYSLEKNAVFRDDIMEITATAEKHVEYEEALKSYQTKRQESEDPASLLKALNDQVRQQKQVIDELRQQLKKDGKDLRASTSEGEEAPNELRAVVYPLEGIDAEKLQDVVTFAESLPGSASLDGVSHSLVVNDTSENQDKISGYLTKLREGQETELKNRVEILAARKRVAAKVKEFGKDHPAVRKAQFEVSNLERAIAEKSQGAKSAEKFPITTTIFEADDEAINQITDSDALGKLIPKKDAKKKFDSLAGKKKVAIIWKAGLLCRVGQPSRFFNGGESLLEPAPEDAIWVGQKLESVEFGDIGQVTVLDKKSRDGQRVLKYELEFTKRSYGNASKYEGTVLPLSFGQVFRGYAVVPDPKSEGVLIGPVGTVGRTSDEGVTREVSTYLWIRSEEERLVPVGGSQ